MDTARASSKWPLSFAPFSYGARRTHTHTSASDFPRRSKASPSALAVNSEQSVWLHSLKSITIIKANGVSMVMVMVMGLRLCPGLSQPRSFFSQTAESVILTLLIHLLMHHTLGSGRRQSDRAVRITILSTTSLNSLFGLLPGRANLIFILIALYGDSYLPGTMETYNVLHTLRCNEPFSQSVGRLLSLYFTPFSIDSALRLMLI